MPKLYFPIGVSGSGKSTYIKKHFKPEIVVSPDELRRKFTGDVTNHTQEGKVWATVPILLKQKLEKYGEAVLDATNVDSGSRAGLLKKFSRDFVERIAIVFEADPEESKRRIKTDLEAGKDRSDVPDEVIDKQQEKFRRGFNTIKQQFDKVIYADRGEVDMKEGKIKNFLKFMSGIPNKDVYLNKVVSGTAFKDGEDVYFAIRNDGKKWLVQKNVSPYEIGSKDEDFILKNSLPYHKKNQKHPTNYENKKWNTTMKTYKESGQMAESIKITKEDIAKVRKIVNEEMKLLKEEDAEEAQERAQYQSYQDMYLVPQSHWKLKKYANMYDANGNLYRGKLGEVHKLQTVEYDFMHTGEVVTECGDETYSLDAQDFRECFEMAHDEEGLKVNNESIIKEEIKKLVKIKDYFGKNIKGSIERLEEAFLTEDDIWKKLTDILQKLKAQSTYLDGREEDELNGILETFGIIKVGDELELPNGAARNAYEALKNFYEGERNRSSKREPEDAHLDQDFEDRISGDGPDLYENITDVQYVIKRVDSGKKEYVNNVGNGYRVIPSKSPFSDDKILKFNDDTILDALKLVDSITGKIFVVDSTGQQFNKENFIDNFDKIKFMNKHGLGDRDMHNDITYLH